MAISFLFVGCGPKYSGKNDILFRGTHELKKFNVKTDKSSNWRAGYFLIAGAASGRTSEKTVVSFSWQMWSGEYVMSQMDWDKCRVKIDSTVQVPYIKFHWVPNDYAPNDISYHISANVNYMVIHCKEEDFPTDINITEL
jgi:hypothetical protein